MTDAEFTDLMAQMGRYSRKKVIHSLLVGNDGQCFSTKQYMDRYTKLIVNGDQRIMKLEYARVHLEGLGKFYPSPVKEVRPDLWTLRQTI